jgi:hypothetical protein
MPDNPLMFSYDVKRGIDGSTHTVVSSITLRDMFAAFALNGLMASNAVCSPAATEEVAARAAFNLADAMLAERAK